MAARMEKVGEVSSIYFYPLKSCRGISIEEAECDEFGIKYDRHWAILDRGGRITSLSSKGELAMVVPTMLKDSIRIEAPGMEELFIPMETSGSGRQQVEVDLHGLSGTGVHVSDEANEWFTKYLGKPYSLLAFDRSTCQPRALHLDKKFGDRPLVKQSDKLAFQHKCPYHLISENSLEKVNEICEKLHCEMQRFRPNIVVKGCDAFAEDEWEMLKIGDTEFRCLHRCPRCILPNVDPETGFRDKDEPFKSLRKFRIVPKEEDAVFGSAPILGRNLGIEKCGVIKVGDPVYAKI